MPLDIFVLGDSNTAGLIGGTNRLLKKTETWPYRLRALCEGAQREFPRLAVRSCSVDGLPGRSLFHCLPDFGVTEGKAPWERLLQKAEGQTDSAGKATVLVVSLGVNDLANGEDPDRAFAALCEYLRQGRERLLGRFPERDLVVLYVGHPGFDYARLQGGFRDAFCMCGETHARFRAATRDLSGQPGLGGPRRRGGVVSVSLDELDPARDLGPDGVHFTAEAHARVAELAFAALKDALREEGPEAKEGTTEAGQ